MLIMENSEEIMQILERFTRLKQKDIPRELEEYLCFVAKTGDTVFRWSAVKALFREKLVSVIKQFHEQSSVDELPQYPNVDPFNYETMKTALLERLDGFSSAPFTIQRISELLTEPRNYTRIDKFMRAIEKNILVVSTVEPGRKPQLDNSDYGDSLDSSMVNGSNVVSVSDDLNADIDVDIEMNDNNNCSATTTTALPPINTLNSPIIQIKALVEDPLSAEADDELFDSRSSSDVEKICPNKKRAEEDAGGEEVTKKCKLDEESVEVVVKVDPELVENISRTDDPLEPPPEDDKAPEEEPLEPTEMKSEIEIHVTVDESLSLVTAEGNKEDIEAEIPVEEVEGEIEEEGEKDKQETDSNVDDKTVEEKLDKCEKKEEEIEPKTKDEDEEKVIKEIPELPCVSETPKENTEKVPEDVLPVEPDLSKARECPGSAVPDPVPIPETPVVSMDHEASLLTTQATEEVEKGEKIAVAETVIGASNMIVDEETSEMEVDDQGVAAEPMDL